MNTILYSLSRELEMTAIDAELEAECYKEEFDKYEIDFALEDGYEQL